MPGDIFIYSCGSNYIFVEIKSAEIQILDTMRLADKNNFVMPVICFTITARVYFFHGTLSLYDTWLLPANVIFSSLSQTFPQLIYLSLSGHRKGLQQNCSEYQQQELHLYHGRIFLPMSVCILLHYYPHHAILTTYYHRPMSLLSCHRKRLESKILEMNVWRVLKM